MTAWIHDPMAVFTFCVVSCAVVIWSAEQEWASGFYKVIPSIVLIYYLPTLASNLGVIPTQSPAYDWMRDYLLPFSLFLLMVTTDIPTVLKVGPKAILMMLFGTLGVVVGGPIAFLLFRDFLPPDSWKALASLSGSWIGGGGNFAAVKESVGASDELIGPIIIVDTAVGYTWMGILLILSNYQKIFDRWNRARTDLLDDLNERIARLREETQRPIDLKNVVVILAIGLLGAILSQAAGFSIFELTNPYLRAKMPSLASIFSSFTWMVILITTFGIFFSFTRLREIEYSGGSRFGYAALYIFVASLGAKADLAGLVAAPAFLLVGIVWILFHVGFLLVGARLIRAPLFLLAVGSQANVGGAATAPIVAAAYYSAMAPVGVLMGMLGYLLGTYAGLFCAFLMRLVA